MKKELTIEQHNELCRLGYKGGKTIGDLIEFLDEHNFFLDLIRFNNKKYKEWKIYDHRPGKQYDKGWVNKEFCDALCQAIKEVLESSK